MDNSTKRYHENMSKVFNAPNVSAEKNIERHEENLKKIEKEKKEPDEVLDEE